MPKPLGTYALINSTTLGSAQSSVTFSSIPGTYTDLIIVNRGSFSNDDNGYALTFNGDTGSNYSTTYIYGNGSSGVSVRVTNASSINAGRLNTSFGLGITHVMDYANTVTNKTILTRGNSGGLVNFNVGLWRNTAAITSLTISVPTGITNFSSGSVFKLYGITAGNQ